MKNTTGADDYFLGGRGLSGPVAALSAQASDMSGWLLMGLPGSVYALGTGQAWIDVYKRQLKIKADYYLLIFQKSL